jgi:alpha-N-arabinofuranosidase
MSYQIHNPIIPGFYPDPSIIRVEDDFYIACSSFELCPGIPIFHSRDLANWEQICYAVTPENGFHVEYNGMTGGVMAPTLRYNQGTYYIINANFSDAGNYIITAKNPAGPWSKPHFLDDVPGIDASIFFDTDGQCYIIGTGDVWENGAGGKERGIWIAKYDIDHFKMVGEPVCIFNSALRVGASPESPHIYHIGEYYYLLIAEGGTEHYHAVMAARSKDVMGFYEGNPANPVLTHRHLGFCVPITNIGHADLVELQDGSYYAVMLGSRLLEGKGKNLGRETFLCPVIWQRDWPVFAPETGKVEWEYPAPKCLEYSPVKREAEREDFDGETLGLEWSCLGTPYEKFYEIRDSRLSLMCGKNRLNEEIRKVGFVPEYRKDTWCSMLARRQRNPHQVMTCQMHFTPHLTEGAGLVVMQAMNHMYKLERRKKDGQQMLMLVLSTADYDLPNYMPQFTCETKEAVIASVVWPEEDIILSVELDNETFTFRYGSDEDHLKELAVCDGALINPEKVGCMVGTMVGMYATGNGESVDNRAEFDWFELK